MEATPAATKPAKKASPLSSPRFSASSPNVRRIFEEKEEMQNLNDRLAVYIDKMRRLEDRNSSLTAEVTRWKEKESSEVSEVKKIFEGELANARQLFDDIAKEKSRIELENARNSSLASDLQKKLDKESQSSARAEEKVKSLTKKLNEKDALLADLRDEHISLKEQFDKLKKESSNLQDALNSARYDLEQKTLEKVDLENRIQTLSEDSDFKRRMYEQELSDIKEQLVTFESSKSYMETDFKQKYDNVMKDKLQELRYEFEEEADNIKNDIENNYTHKLSDLKNSQNNTRAECERQTVIIRECKACLEALKIDKSVLETELNSYKKRLEELERLRAVEKDDLNEQLEEKSNEIKDLKDIIDERNKEYEELMGIKVALDLEISAYRKLLEGEEERLNITATQTPSPPRRKRARIDVDSPQGPDVVSTAKGSIQIAECDPEGKFVKIFNSSANEEPLGGWVVERKTGDQDAVGFKFNPRSILKGGATVTLWSAGSGMKHKPPTDLVMKTSNWAPGTDALTTIQNSEGEIVAQMTQTSPLEKEPIRRKQRRRTDKNESCVIS